MRFLPEFLTPREEKKLSERLDAIEDRFQKLETSMKALQLDWDNAYERLHSMMGRVARRAQVASKAEQMHDYAESQGSLAPLPLPEEQIAQAYLTPRQRQLQMSILSRRRQLNGREKT